MSFAPTAEQLLALELFQTGKSLVIEAGAGAGKTSTLKLFADASPDRLIQYVAFNKAIVDESKSKFPSNVKCNTAHSLAFGAIGKNYAHRLNTPRMKSWTLATLLRVDPIRVENYAGENKQISAGFLAGLVMRAIERFCQTADPEPTRMHVPLIENLDPPGFLQRGKRSYPINNEIARALEPALRRAWDDLRHYDGALPFKPSHYLKMWQLSKPRINRDVILFDEAQDASPVMLDVVQRQAEFGTQLVFVGDSQQAIYEFTGAVNALQTVEVENTAYLSQSFRFGDAIAEIANSTLRRLQSPLQLTGLDSIPSVVEKLDAPRTILTRTNATAVRSVLDAIKEGRAPFLVGGGSEVLSFARAAGRLVNGDRVEHPELACFESWGEVQEYVESDEQGGDLKLLVELIDEFGVERIIEALDNTTPEHRADVIVSTAHKSKGREWDSVRLADDFKENPDTAELRLLYVAVTRAKLSLDISAVTSLTGVMQAS